jgi:sigma-B regulation protein RsbU (phosphoserine phosphatase)
MASAAPHNPAPDRGDPLHVALHRQLLQRRKVLAEAIGQMPEFKIAQLLHEVDSALERFATGQYGICERCDETVEDERLLADPLTRVCLCELTKQQIALLEKDLMLAAQIQSRLLPRRELRCDGWGVAHHYRPLGLVSGDYCDLVMAADNQLYFMLGDVAGKGVAASLLMSNLSAIFRALVPIGLPLGELMKRANRIFAASTLPNQFATLICGRTLRGGVELCGAGHVPALLVNGDEVTEIASQGLPMGLYCEQEFTSAAYEVAPGGSLVLFSDGVSESHAADEEYGYGRIAAAAVNSRGQSPAEMVANCMRDLECFLGGEAVFDDQTLMVVQRSV